MGETIYITLTLLDGNLPQTWQRDVAEKHAQLSAYGRDIFKLDTEAQTITSTEEINWYDFKEGMKTLSEAFTPLRLELYIEPLSGTPTLVYAYGGKIQVEPGRIEFGPCTLWS